MLLSKPQTALVALIQQVKFITRPQLYALATQTPELSELTLQQFTPMVNQLCQHHNTIRMVEEVVTWSGKPPPAHHLEAIDILLQISNGAPVIIPSSQNKSYLIQFVLDNGGKLQLFTVAPFANLYVPFWFPTATERVVFISTAEELKQNPELCYKHFFAVRQADGNHRFYEGRSK